MELEKERRCEVTSSTYDDVIVISSSEDEDCSNITIKQEGRKVVCLSSHDRVVGGNALRSRFASPMDQVILISDDEDVELVPVVVKKERKPSLSPCHPRKRQRKELFWHDDSDEVTPRKEPDISDDESLPEILWNVSPVKTCIAEEEAEKQCMIKQEKTPVFDSRLTCHERTPVFTAMGPDVPEVKFEIPPRPPPSPPASPESVRSNQARALQSYLWRACGLPTISVACRKPGVCVKKHANERGAQPSSVQFETLMTTMLSDNTDRYLQEFAFLQLSYRGVSPTVYLCPRLVDLLFEILIGSCKLKKLPDKRLLKLGLNVLNLQMQKHPPCKPGMNMYYSLVCEKWWPILLSEIDQSILNQNRSATDDPHSSLREMLTEDELLKLHRGISQTARFKREEHERAYLRLSVGERMERHAVPLRYFVSLFEQDVLAWLVKCWSPKVAAFRTSVRPVVANLMWGTDTINEGQINLKCKQVLQLFTKYRLDPLLRKLFARLISVLAEVIRRKEAFSHKYPQIGDLCIDLARQIYLHMKKTCDLCGTPSTCKHLCGALATIYPAWLRFHVGAFFLDVDAPANFYKIKEALQLKVMERNGVLSSEDQLLLQLTIAAGAEMIQADSDTKLQERNEEETEIPDLPMDESFASQQLQQYRALCKHAAGITAFVLRRKE